LGLVIGGAAIRTGLVVLVAPGQVNRPGYDPFREALTWFGMGFIGGGVGLLMVQLRSSPVAATWLGHLALASRFGAFCRVTALPARAGTGGLLSGGIGALIGVRPWLGPRLRGIDAASLHLRLTLARIVAASLPLGWGGALVADQAERTAIAEGLLDPPGLATSLAPDLARSVEPYLARMSTVNRRADLVTLPVED
jgi:hypothetical protein